MQIDGPFLPDIFFEVGLDDVQKKRRAQMYIEAINAGLKGIPAERVRFHTCYRINEGPRIYEAALADIIEYVLKINAGSYSFEAANPRHEHEYHLFERVKVPEGKVLVPGVITHASNIVEHPELIAERIIRFARLVGRENVIAGADCGFSSQALYRTEVHRTVVWEKFKAMRAGADIATRTVVGLKPRALVSLPIIAVVRAIRSASATSSGGIDVEERVNRSGWPCRYGDTVSRDPVLDLAHAIVQQRVPQIRAQGERPQATTGCRRCAEDRAGEPAIGLNAREMQAFDQVRRQERAVARCGHDPFDLRRMIGGPIEPGQDAGKGTGKIRQAVGHDTQTYVCEAARIAIRIENHLTALRNKAGDDSFEHGRAANADPRLIVATYPARQAAGKHKTESGTYALSNALTVSVMRMASF